MTPIAPVLLLDALTSGSATRVALVVACTLAPLIAAMVQILGTNGDTRDVHDRRPIAVVLRPFADDRRRRTSADLPWSLRLMRVEAFAGCAVLLLIAPDNFATTAVVVPLAGLYLAASGASLAWWRQRDRSNLERLARSLRRAVGPVWALASDATRAVPHGPSLIHAITDTWQPTCIDLCERARCAVLIAGESDALAWELTLLACFADPRRVALFVDPSVGVDPKRWQALVERMDGLGWSLPSTPPCGQALVFFDADGRTAHFEDDLGDDDLGPAVARRLADLEPPDRLLPHRLTLEQRQTLIHRSSLNTHDPLATWRPALWLRVVQTASADFGGWILVGIGTVAMFATLVQVGDTPKSDQDGYVMLLLLSCPGLVWLGILAWAEITSPGMSAEQAEEIELLPFVATVSLVLGLNSLMHGNVASAAFWAPLAIGALLRRRWTLWLVWIEVTLSLVAMSKLQMVGVVALLFFLPIALVVTAARDELRDRPQDPE